MNIYQFALLAIPLLLLNLNLVRQAQAPGRNVFRDGLAVMTVLIDLVVFGVLLILGLEYGMPKLYQFYLYLGTL